jgi:F0F1-type ATP synthase assembly protein I
VGFFIGKWVDAKMANKEPYGILFFSTIFLIMALYSIVKDVLKSEK